MAEPLKYVASKWTELQKSHADYATHLEKERDTSYADLKEVKVGYDKTCQSVEDRRKKADSSLDASKSKSQLAYQDKLADMHNQKNLYLIAIQVTNQLEQTYYHHYVPELLDSLQDVSESRTNRLNSIWSLATQLEESAAARISQNLQQLSAEIEKNDPSLTSMMFIKHNPYPWKEPPDFAFQPSAVWHDDDTVVTSPSAKVVLRNILEKSKEQVRILKRDVETKQREVDAVKVKRGQVREGKDKSDEVEVVRTVFKLQEELHQADRKRLTADVETLYILAAVGDVTKGTRSHTFRTQTFKIPDTCDLCGERIWGIAAKGWQCGECDYVCHTKCQLKVPADCPGETPKEERKKLKAQRQEGIRERRAADIPTIETTAPPPISRSNTMNSLASSFSTGRQQKPVPQLTTPEDSTITGSNEEPIAKPKAVPKDPIPGGKRSRVVAPPPASYVSDQKHKSSSDAAPSRPLGKMLYSYKASGPEEITVAENDSVTIIEPDDGSGWIKVEHDRQQGIVPTTYLEISPRAAAQSRQLLAPTSASSTSNRPASVHSQSSAVSSGDGQTKKRGPAVAPRRGGARRLKHVQALYDYTARTDSEFSCRQGDVFVLVGADAGDGWVEVERGGAVKSVPANYVQETGPD